MADGLTIDGKEKGKSKPGGQPGATRICRQGRGDLIRKSAISPQVVEVAEPVSACRGLVIDRVTLGSVGQSRVCTLRQ